ncbi:hypothetical protein NP493_548g02000 [Ridgeia piscesae]|uniref:Uncharacterized protein n=1 Tax=Ridgeia piscesae TaxID=27915 RepID=A0AAD9NPU1_RIDPI|nr:hypothetical protein NP493_548g02000 [Ridgeia piscesae]
MTCTVDYSGLARATEEQTYLLRQMVEVQQQRLVIDTKRLQYLELDRGSYH